jgi:hypothetical protein
VNPIVHAFVTSRNEQQALAMLHEFARERLVEAFALRRHQDFEHSRARRSNGIDG